MPARSTIEATLWQKAVICRGRSTLTTAPSSTPTLNLHCAATRSTTATSSLVNCRRKKINSSHHQASSHRRANSHRQRARRTASLKATNPRTARAIPDPRTRPLRQDRRALRRAKRTNRKEASRAAPHRPHSRRRPLRRPKAKPAMNSAGERGPATHQGSERVVAAGVTAAGRGAAGERRAPGPAARIGLAKGYRAVEFR